MMSKIFSFINTPQLITIDSNTEPIKSFKSPAAARHAIHDDSFKISLTKLDLIKSLK